MNRPAILLLAAAALATPHALTAQTLDLPQRKAGLWEITLAIEKPKATPAVTTKVCLDPTTDRELMDYGLKLSDGKCKSLTSRREGKSLIVESDCAIGGKSTKTRTVMTGDFQSAYSVRSEGTIDADGKGPRAVLTTQEATWKSADCPGMKPGDMTMFGGVKVNIKQMKALSGLIR